MTAELLRQGAIAEIVGPLGSGRTSLLTACLAEATRTGVAALVDADGAFDPVSAARAGVTLARLLWVRCDGRRDAALRAVDLLVRCPGFTLVALDVGESPPRVPLSTAFRWRLAARRAGLALVVVGCRRLLDAGAGLALATARGGLAWAGPAAVPTRLARMQSRVRVVRDRRARAAAPRALWWSP